MSRVRVTWDDEAKTILRYEFDYAWTWEELERANQHFAELFNSVSHEVCSIAIQNYTQNYIPPNPIARIGAMLPRKNQRKILSVLVIRSSLVASIFEMIIKLYPAASSLRIVNSLEDARVIIQQYQAERHA